MVIGTSRCAHVLCYLFCWRDDRAHPKARRARPPLIHPVLRRSVTLARTLAAGSLAERISEWDAAMHPAPEDYLLGQRSRRIYRSRSTQPPLEAVRRPTLAFGNRHTSAPVHRRVDVRRPKSRAGSRLSLPAPNQWSEPPECVRNYARAATCRHPPLTTPAKHRRRTHHHALSCSTAHSPNPQRAARMSVCAAISLVPSGNSMPASVHRVGTAVPSTDAWYSPTPPTTVSRCRSSCPPVQAMTSWSPCCDHRPQPEPARNGRAVSGQRKV